MSTIIIHSYDIFLNHKISAISNEAKLLNESKTLVFFDNTAYTPSSANTLILIRDAVSSNASSFQISLNVGYYNTSVTNNNLSTSIFIQYTYMYGYFSYLTYQLFTYSDNLRTCPDGQYLSMPLLIVSAPMSCVPCHITCKSCLIADMTNYSLTQSNCLSCYG